MRGDSVKRPDVEEAVPPRPPPSVPHEQISVRIPTSWLADADELAVVLARPGFTTTRSDILRAAIAKGLEVLRRDAGATTPQASSPPRRRGTKRS
jgi:hypothetical protein